MLLPCCRSAPPQAVIYPQSTEEVALAVKLCSHHRVPIVPFGAGTSLEGHIAALQGGVAFDMSQMNRILEVRQLLQRFMSF